METTDELSGEIFRSLDIDGTLLPEKAGEQEKFRAFRALLIRRVEELAEKDMEKLLTALYLIDVSEKKLHEAMRQTSPQNLSSAIADLIIERQIQKVRTRKEHGGKEGEWDFDV